MNSTTPSPRRQAPSRSPVIARRRRGSQSPGTSPATASLWGDVVMRFWTHAISQGEATLSMPLEVWQLTPADAGAVQTFARALMDRVALLGDGARVRLFVCTPAGRIPSAWRAVPEMRAWIKEGFLAPLDWIVEEEPLRSMKRRASRSPPTSLNPVAVFAHWTWSDLEREIAERAPNGFFLAALERSPSSETDSIRGVVSQRAVSSNIVMQAPLTFAKNPHHGFGEMPAMSGNYGFADIDALTTIMKTVAVHGDGNQALAILKLAHGDPRVFAAAGPGMMSQLANLGCDRGAWSKTLAQVWDRHLASSTESSLHRELASVAMVIDDWGLARRILERSMASHGETAADLTLLASCEAQTGQLHKACALAARALANDPEHFQANDVARHLLARAGRFDNLWCRRVSLPGIPVALEPLDVDHAQAFFRQYRDPHIAEMTRLREFAEVDDVRSWIHRMNSAGNRHRYAVMHEDAGFVGYVSLRPSGPDAHFGFWIGTEHQGRGFGTHAGVLLCELARCRGIKHVFAAVFDHNLRSIRALERIGFRPLGLRPADEEDRRTFMCYSRADDLAVETAFRDCLQREQREMELVDANGRPVRVKEDVQ